MSDVGRDICKICKTWADDCTCCDDPDSTYDKDAAKYDREIRADWERQCEEVFANERQWWEKT